MPSVDEKKQEDPFHAPGQSQARHPDPAVRSAEVAMPASASAPSAVVQTPEQRQAVVSLFGPGYGGPAKAIPPLRLSDATLLSAPMKQGHGVEHATGATCRDHAGPSPTLRMQTGQDSRVVVGAKAKGAYDVGYQLGEGKEATRISVAKFSPVANDATALHHLPIYIEDVASGTHRIIHIKYDPERVNLDAVQEVTATGDGMVQVVVSKCKAEDLLVKQAPAARPVDRSPDNRRFTLETDERITQHSSTPEDRIVSALASAEGGFATVEASDAGVFTWGQGQWIVASGAELQKVLSFIKARRPDLFDRYWGSAGLDVQGKVPTFQYQGQAYKNTPEDMLRLFRSSKDRNLGFTNLFAQAGMDPQIQRLQREYLRHEVREFLDTATTTRTDKTPLKPSQWLTERGQALYYSSYKNLPEVAKEYLHAAVQVVVGANADAAMVDAAVQARVAAEFERLFQQSGVKSYEGTGDDKHILGFWGEGGRREAVTQGEQRIQQAEAQRTEALAHGDAASAKAAERSKSAWTRHLSDAKKRESRYQTSARDVDAVRRRKPQADLPPHAVPYFSADMNNPPVPRHIEDEDEPARPDIDPESKHEVG